MTGSSPETGSNSQQNLQETSPQMRAAESEWVAAAQAATTERQLKRELDDALQGPEGPKRSKVFMPCQHKCTTISSMSNAAHYPGTENRV